MNLSKKIWNNLPNYSPITFKDDLMVHASDSTEQQTAESYILHALSDDLSIELEPKKIVLPSGSSVQIDGVNEKDNILCEIYARIGKLKSSQADKVASDFLKMLLVEKSLGGKWQKHFCFASDEAAASLKGKSWIANVAIEMGIEIHVITLPSSIETSVVEAQNRQRMIN